jgi:rubrerythrin
MSTEEDLKQAFAGESQANCKYLAFSKKADAEGYAQVAKLFRAAADAETVHALGHLKNMGGIRDTSDNLKEAIEGETYEFQEMYPPMVDEARTEGNKPALALFGWANKVEEIHSKLYTKALAELGKNPETPIFVCQRCGNTVEGEAPDECPVCGAAKTMFKEIQ